MVIFIIATLLLIAVAIAATRNNSKSREPTKKFTHSLNEEIQQPGNNSYSSLQRQHQHKTIAEIDSYIKRKREEDDDYWGYSGLEYKVLMDRYRELSKKEEAFIRAKLSTVDIETLTANQCIKLSTIIKSKHVFGVFDKELELIDKRLHEVVTKQHIDIISGLNYNQVKAYWKIIKNNHGFIPERIIEEGNKRLANEPPEIRLKRERKNIQTNLSKARKKQATHLIIEYEELLNENTQQLNQLNK